MMLKGKELQRSKDNIIPQVKSKGIERLFKIAIKDREEIVQELEMLHKNNPIFCFTDNLRFDEKLGQNTPDLEKEIISYNMERFTMAPRLKWLE